MKNSSELSEKNESDCGSCVSKGCNSCNSGISNTDNHAPTLFTRRNFGRTVLAASAGALLAGCSNPSKQVAAPAVVKPDSLAGRTGT